MYIVKYKQQITSFPLNSNADWKNLPWEQIQLRISRIIKHIFIAAKKNDLVYVYKLQNYLLNCNELKIALIDQILLKIALYYTSYKDVQLLVKNINKFTLFWKIFTKITKESHTLSIIIGHIKQTLIYLSIKPSWNAKIANYSYKLNRQIILNRSTSKKIFYCDFLLINMIKKLMSGKYINNSIGNWIYNKKYFYLYNLYNLEYKKFFRQYQIKNNIIGKLNYNSLSNLINRIILHDLYWYNFSYIKNNNLFTQSGNNNLFNEINQDIQVQLYNYLAQYNIISSNLNRSVKIKKVDNILNILDCNKEKLLSIHDIQKYNNLINTQINQLAKNNIINDKYFLNIIYAIYKSNNFFYIYNTYIRYNID